MSASQHLKSLPDFGYAERKIPVSLWSGREYKELVRKETVIDKKVEFPHRLDSLLNERFGVVDDQRRKECCNAVLNISDENGIDEQLQTILKGIVENTGKSTLQYQLKDWVMKLKYAHSGQTYWEYIRKLFKEIIYHNICKAYRIQNGQYEIKQGAYKECFESVDFIEILKGQNDFSRDEKKGLIWVLNTCVFFVAEYNFALVTE